MLLPIDISFDYGHHCFNHCGKTKLDIAYRIGDFYYCSTCYYSLVSEMQKLLDIDTNKFNALVYLEDVLVLINTIEISGDIIVYYEMYNALGTSYGKREYTSIQEFLNNVRGVDENE